MGSSRQFHARTISEKIAREHDPGESNDWTKSGLILFTGKEHRTILKLEAVMIEGLLQPQHLLVILVVALFLLGPKKLPELGKGLAEGIRGFKDALKPSDSQKPPQV